jgi:iron(III) transport system substrate-binding protein
VPHTRIVRPAYNSELVKGADVPRSWEDMVDPKWKGKIITTPYQDAWAQLAEVWGEEKVLDYMRKLGALEPKLANFPEIDRRLIAGEVSVTALHLHHYIQAAKEAKAPTETVNPDPALVFVSVSFVPKGARHANAAALLNAWLLSEDGQAYSEKFYRDSSLFRPGTTAAKLAQSIKYVLPKLEYQMANTLRLQKQYEEIIVKR